MSLTLPRLRLEEEHFTGEGMSLLVRTADDHQRTCARAAMLVGESSHDEDEPVS